MKEFARLYYEAFSTFNKVFSIEIDVEGLRKWLKDVDESGAI